MVTGSQELIVKVVQYFLPHCADQSTMTELSEMASNPRQWRYGHDLFRRIRQKTLRAEATNDSLLDHQYLFEEICAKTLFNLSDHYDPQCLEFPERFDDDSALWFLPLAISFAHALGTRDFISSLFGFDEMP